MQEDTGKNIRGKEKSVNELLKETRYSIDYYQREYRWKTKNIEELIEDLSDKFWESYRPEHRREDVEKYDHYFLGPIIICKRDGVNFIVDGQQRLTSLTLLFIYLNNLQSNSGNAVNVDDLIYSERYGQKSFNINIEERTPVIKALYEGRSFDIAEEPESVQNIWSRYEDIERLFPDDLKGDALPYFVDWLKYNVDLVQITAFSDDDAYIIFETMNDRGLSLTPTDMLKGFLLASINDNSAKERINTEWKKKIHRLRQFNREEDADFFKAWFRARYAESIRQRTRGAQKEDFEKIAQYHKWLRDNTDRMGLDSSEDFVHFLQQDFNFYHKWYLFIRKKASKYDEEYRHIYFNDYNNYTLQNQLILSSLTPEDDEVITKQKIKAISYFIDFYFTQRVLNFKSVTYSNQSYNIFQLGKELRGQGTHDLVSILKREVRNNEYQLDGARNVRLNGFTKKYLYYILARMTHFIETEADNASNIEEYLKARNKKFQIEHIWADKYRRHTDEFDNEYEFDEYRNRFGGLLLLPRKINPSLGDKPYEDKIDHYNTQNLLARSLHEQCYQNNPGFRRVKEQLNLHFKPHEQFKKEDLDERQELYYQICTRIWNTEKFDVIIEKEMEEV